MAKAGPFFREESLLTSHLPVLEVTRLLGQLPNQSPSHLVQRRAILCCIELDVFLMGTTDNVRTNGLSGVLTERQKGKDMLTEGNLNALVNFV